MAFLHYNYFVGTHDVLSSNFLSLFLEGRSVSRISEIPIYIQYKEGIPRKSGLGNFLGWLALPPQKEISDAFKEPLAGRLDSRAL